MSLSDSTIIPDKLLGLLIGRRIALHFLQPEIADSPDSRWWKLFNSLIKNPDGSREWDEIAKIDNVLGILPSIILKNNPFKDGPSNPRRLILLFRRLIRGKDLTDFFNSEKLRMFRNIWEEKPFDIQRFGSKKMTVLLGCFYGAIQGGEKLMKLTNYNLITKNDTVKLPKFLLESESAPSIPKFEYPMTSGYTEAEIVSRRKIVYEKCLEIFENKMKPRIIMSNVRKMVDLIDVNFFSGLIRRKLSQTGRPLSYSIISTKGRAAASLITKDGNRYTLQINALQVAKSFADEAEMMLVCGLECYCRLTALILTIEHELIHLLMQLHDMKSDGTRTFAAHGKMFQQAAKAYFGHLNFYHSMGHDGHKIKENTNVKIGDRITFKNKDEHLCLARVTKINMQTVTFEICEINGVKVPFRAKDRIAKGFYQIVTKS